MNANDIIWMNDLPIPINHGKRHFQFSKDLLKGTYGGFTVIYMMLQIAFYMGINELYLLGLEFSFQESKSTNRKADAGEEMLESENEINHFHPDYRKKGELWTKPRLDYQYEAFKVAKKVFEEEGRTIKNASRNTKLNLFLLIKFDSVINS